MDHSVEYEAVASRSDLPPNCVSENNDEGELTSDEDSRVEESGEFSKRLRGLFEKQGNKLWCCH